MVRHFSLSTIFLVLTFGGTVAAQQTLVQYQDKSDPCSRFKMRILVPDNSTSHKLLVRKPHDGLDSRMVWNPCLQPESQLALAPPNLTPDQAVNLLVQSPFTFQSAPEKNPQRQRSELLLRHPPSSFQIKRPQKQQ